MGAPENSVPSFPIGSKEDVLAAEESSKAGLVKAFAGYEEAGVAIKTALLEGNFDVVEKLRASKAENEENVYGFGAILKNCKEYREANPGEFQ